jgi:hypothetical protein
MSRIRIKDQAKRKYLELRKRLDQHDIEDDGIRPILLRKLYYYLGQYRVYNRLFVRDKTYRKTFYKSNRSRMADYQKLYGLKRRGKKLKKKVEKLIEKLN